MAEIIHLADFRDEIAARQLAARTAQILAAEGALEWVKVASTGCAHRVFNFTSDGAPIVMIEGKGIVLRHGYEVLL